MSTTDISNTCIERITEYKPMGKFPGLYVEGACITDSRDDQSVDIVTALAPLPCIGYNEDGESCYLRDLNDEYVKDVYSDGRETVYHIAFDGLHLYWHVDNTIDVYDNDPGAREYFAGWDLSQYNEDFAVLLSSFGFDPANALNEADENHEGPVKVWASYNYYEGAGNPIDGYLREQNGEIGMHGEEHKFASYAEAQAWIDEQESEVYHLGHNEHSRPDYTICEA